MRTLVFLLLLILGSCIGRADPDTTPPAPVGILILKDVAGYKATAAQFVSIQWVNNDGGFVVEESGNKLPFINNSIGRIIYFNPFYYDEVDHNQSWLDWRAGLQSREVVVPPLHPVSLGPEALAKLHSEAELLQNIIEMYPAGKSLVDPIIASLQDDCTKLSNGLVLQDGKWMSAKDVSAANDVPRVGDSEHLITFTTKDGKQYTNAKASVTDTGLSIITSDGGAGVSFDELPDDLSVFPANIRKEIQDRQAKVVAKKTQETAEAAKAASSTTSGSGFFDQMGTFFSAIIQKLVQVFTSSSPPSSKSPASTNSPPSNPGKH